MNRRDFQRLAGVRSREAEVLLHARQYSGAYYLAGYAVEAALKACIAKQTRRHDFPPKESAEAYTHNLVKLLRLAGLEHALGRDSTDEAQLEVNWGVAKDWSEQSRYEKKRAAAARDLFSAIHDPQHGILQWLRQYW